MTPNLTPELLADLIAPEQLHISSDGGLAVYVARITSKKDSGPIRSSIWLADTKVINSAKQLTSGNVRDSAPAFNKAGDTIAFLSDRAEAGKQNDIYVMPISDHAEVDRLTNSIEHGTVSEFKWTTDGNFIVFNSKPLAEEIDIKVYGENILYQNLWMVDVRTKAVNRLINENVDVDRFDISADGSSVVYCTRSEPTLVARDNGQDIKVLDIRAKTSKKFSRTDFPIASMCWSEQPGEVFVGGSCKAGFIHSAVVHLATQTNIKVYAYGEKNDSYVVKSTWNLPVSHVVEGMKDSIRRTRDDVILYESTQTIADYDVAGDSLVVITSKANSPSEVYSIVNGTTTQLSQHGQHVVEMNIGRSILIEESHNGIPMTGLWTIPTSLESDFDKKPLPTVVVCKGGPYGRTNDNFNGATIAHIVPYLVAQGYLTLHPNYRGGSAHGEAYANSVAGHPDLSYEDVIWHVKKGIADGRIDPDRVAITGWSQGGYLSYLAVTRDFPFTCAIACAGVSDLYVESATSDLPYLEAALMGYGPWDKGSIDKPANPASPIHNSWKVKTPLLMLHGEEDVRVTIQNVYVFQHALKKHGIKFESAIYPREAHGGPWEWERAHHIDLLERMGKFLAKYMKK